MKNPYVGQTVLLILPSPAIPPGPDQAPVPAVVTFVHDDCCVNLEIMTGKDRGTEIPGVVYDGGPSIGKVRWDFTDGDKPIPATKLVPDRKRSLTPDRHR